MLRVMAVNIHSHLWGAVLFAFILFTFDANHIARHKGSAGWADFGVFTVFLSSAVFCMGASAFYHTVGSHSDDVSASLAPPAPPSDGAAPFGARKTR
jgi:adiponectin receptor